MSQTLATCLIVGALALMAGGVVVAVRDRPAGVALLGGAVLLELGVLAQVGVTVAAVVGGAGPGERATLYGYLAGMALIPPVGVFVALAERSRWGAAVLALAGFAVAVMTGRLLQIWGGP